MLLLEQVLSVGMLGLLLLVVAAMTIQTGRGNRMSKLTYEASCVAQNVLEKQLARSVSLIPLGPQAAVQDKFSDESPYTLSLEAYSLGGTGIAAGLSDDEIKRLKVSVRWVDQAGSHVSRCEGIAVKLPR